MNKSLTLERGQDLQARKFEIRKILSHNYLTLSGVGYPQNNIYFELGVSGLMKVSETIRILMSSGNSKLKYKSLPLEISWRTDNQNQFNYALKSKWQWRLMILQPSQVSHGMLEKAIELNQENYHKKLLKQIGLTTIKENLVAQTLHRGPYSTQDPSYKLLLKYMYENGYRPSGQLHEIYLTNPRETWPSDWLTLLRKPIEKH